MLVGSRFKIRHHENTNANAESRKYGEHKAFRVGQMEKDSQKNENRRELTCTAFSRNHSSKASSHPVKPKSSRWSEPPWPHQYPQYPYPPFYNSYFLFSLSLDRVIALVEAPAADTPVVAVADFG